MKLAIILCLILFATGCQSQPPTPSTTPTQQQAHDDHSDDHDPDDLLKLSRSQQMELQISTAPVVAASGQSTGLRPGRIAIDPDQQAIVSSQVSGTVQGIYAQVGSDLTAGSLVTIISSPEVTSLQAEYHEAEVEAELARKELTNKEELFQVGDEIQRPGETAKLELSEAQAKKASAKARLESAVLKNERLETLLEEGIASRQQVEESRAERSALEADLTQADVALEIAQGHLVREKRILESGLAVKAETFPAQARLARAAEKMRHAKVRLQQLGANPEGHSGLIRLYSPISGTVVEREVSQGELVSPGSQIALIVETQKVWAWIDLQQEDLNIVDKGDPIELSLVDKPQETVKGRLDFLSPRKDEKSQTVKARVVLTDPPKGFRLGTFVHAKIVNGHGDVSPALPQKSVQFVKGETVVYVREPGGFRRVSVKLGSPINENLVSVTGLKIGSEIVVTGAEQLKSMDLSNEIGGHGH